MGPRLAIAALLVLAVSTGCPTVEDPPPPPPPDEVTPVYVTLGTHLERLAWYPESFPEDCDQLAEFQDKLLAYADLFEEYGVKWNLQTAHAFPSRIGECENSGELVLVGGDNILAYLHHQRNVMVDAHLHDEGVGLNYTDVAVILGKSGVPFDSLTVVGGYETDNQQAYDDFAAGLAGAQFPDTVWSPDIYTFPAVPGHIMGTEDFTSGVWRPAGFDYDPSDGAEGELYFQDDPDARMIVAGSGHLHGCETGYDNARFWRASDYVETLVRYLDEGTAPADRVYTATVATMQFHMYEHEDYLPLIEEQLMALQPYVEDGRVVYAYFQDLPRLWEQAYDQQPNLFLFGEVDEADFTCDGAGNPI